MVEKLGVIQHFDMTYTVNDLDNNLFSQVTQNIQGAHLIMFMTGSTFAQKGGKGWWGAVCNLPIDKRASTNLYMPQSSRMGRVRDCSSVLPG